MSKEIPQPFPQFKRLLPGADEMYDTLDDFRPDALESIQTLHKELLDPLKGCVGIVIGGQASLSDPSDGYWGKAFKLDTGEHVQIRVCPRNMVGKKLGQTDTLMIGVRRTGTLMVPRVCFAIVFNPNLGSFGCSMDDKLSSARTIGCRGVHIMLPSLFNMHDPHRDKNNGHADVDLSGFHSIRPSTLTITKAISKGKSMGEVTVSVCPGDSYMVMAGHMGGVNIPDPLTRPSMSITDSDHQRRIGAKSRKLVQAMGDHNSSCMVSSALTISEIISAEGVLGIMCNSFFEGVVPDMMHSPIGTPLIIVMAIHVACFPDRYKLPASTESDRYACRELRALFEARWNNVMASNGYRAIDCVMSAAYENSMVRLDHEKKTSGNMESYFEDTMLLWQRVGQRVATKLMSDIYEEEKRTSSSVNLNTRFGRADLLDDPISAAKYAYLDKCGLARPVQEAPINRLFLASKSDLRTTLLRIHDSAETWLRTGLYGDIRLSAKNVNVGAVPPACKKTGDQQCDCINSESSSSSDDEDMLLDNKLNKEAMESGAGAISTAMIHGPFVMHQFGIETYLVGDGCSNLCADCDKPVGVLQGILLSSRAGECTQCNRRRCYECSEAAIRRMNPKERCKRCEPGSYQPRKSLVPAANQRRKPK